MDIARRLALENFIALAPDGLSTLRPAGWSPEASTASSDGEETSAQTFQQLDAAKVNQDFVAAARYMKNSPLSNGHVGVMGFCWGGGMVNRLATLMPDLGAGSAYYGAPPNLADVAKIQAPLNLNYGALDTRVTGTWPRYEAALKAAGKTNYNAYIYEGAMHSFNNETTTGYNKAAADLSWMRTIALMNKSLRV